MKHALTLLCLSLALFQARASKDPSGFIENNGQIADRAGKLHPEMLYMYKTPNAKITFQKDRIIYYFEKVIKRATSDKPVERGKPSGALIGETRIDFVMKGSNPDVEIIPGEVIEGVKLNYFLAHCPQGVSPTIYRTLTYKEIYPFIDLVFKETEKGLKYDIVLHKGADISNIKFIYEGAKQVSIEKGQLHVVTELYDIREDIPLAFLNEDVNQKADVQFRLNAKKELSFSFNKSVPYETLTIDPVITWLTLFEKAAGNGYMDDFYSDLTTDASGNAYVVFAGTDANLPVINTGGLIFYDPTINGSADIYLAKFNSNRSFVWGTYYGGTDYDITTGATVLTTGNGALHMVASVESNDAPMPNAGGGAYYSTSGKVLYANFNLSTGNLRHATKVGGGSLLYSSVAVSNAGEVAIAYPAYSFNNPPILNRAGAYNQATNGGFTDLFVMTLSTSLAQTWGTYLGGAGSCNGVNVTYDSNNNLFFVAEVGVANPASTEHLVNPGGGAYYQTNGDGGYDLMIGKFNTSGALVWNTLYGGNGRDGLGASMGNNTRILCNSANEVFLCGGTSSTNLPVQNPGGGAYYVGTAPVNVSTGGSYPDYSSFLLKFTNSGVRQWATYWGDNNGGGDHLWSIAFDKCNNLFALGRSHGMVAINQPGFYNNSLPYVSNSSSMISFMMKFNSSLQATWASYIGDTTSYKFMSYVPNTSRLLICGTVNEAYMPFTDPGGGAYFDAVNNSDYKQSFSMLEFNVVPPPLLASTAYTVCSSATATLTASGGIGSTYEWYTGPSGGSPIFTGPSYVTPAVTTNTTYYVSSSNGTCTSDRTPVTVSVTAASTVPGAVSSSAASICPGGSSTLTISGGSLVAGDTWQWYSGSCGGTAIGSGNSIVVSPSSTTSYYVRAEGACGNTSCTSANINVNSNSIAPSSISTSASTVCAGATVTLSILASNGGTLGTGASWQWFSGSCTGTAEGTGNSIVVSPSSTTTYFVKAVGTCNTTGCTNVTINVNDNSTAATSINTTGSSLCSGGSATLTANGGSLGTAANWQWYSGSCGGTAVGSGNSIVVTPGASTNYYVRAEGTCGNTACVTTAITVNPVSIAATGVTASSATLCSSASATLTVNGGSLGAGASWQWFSGSCTGTAEGTGSSITVSPSSTTTYFVKAVGTCNTTGCSSVTVNVSNNSTAATSINTTGSSLCTGGTATLTANGGSLGTAASWQWYSGSCGGTAVGSGNSIVVTPGSSTTYYVRAEGACGNTSCVSTAVNVDAVSTAPAGVTASSATLCSSANATLTVNGGSLGTGASWQWFSGSCTGTAAGTGSSITVSPSSTTTYFVKAVGTCNTTGCSSVTVNVNSNSTAATSINTSTTSICTGGSANLSANGGSLGTAASWQWYSGSCGGTAVGSGASISVSPSSTTVYYLRAEGSCGNTSCVSTTVNVNTPSSAPVSVSASGSSTICSGSTTTLTVNGGSLGTGASWQWFSGSCSGTAEGTGSSITVSPSSATTYYVKAVGTCNTTGCSSVAVNVNTVSTAPASVNATSASICSGTSSTLTVSGGSLGTGGTWHWYASGCGSTPVATGSSIVVSPALNTAYFVRAEDLCGNSVCAQVTVSVTTTPSASWTSPGTVCSGSGMVNLSALVTGNTGGTWTGTGVSGTNFDPSALTGQTIPVTYSVANGSCTASLTQSISVAASVSANWSSPGTLCASNGTVNLTSYLSGSAGGTWSGTGVSGTTFDPSALSGNIAITYAVGSGACSDSKTYTINVSPAASASWTSPGTLCASSGTVNLTSYLSGTAGGTWTGTGVSGSVFDPSGLAGQTILIGYQVGSNPCIASQSHTIQVVNLANASFTLPATICENAAALNLNASVTGNGGGVFSGTGISANSFNPSGLAGQSIVITYSVGTMPCSASQTQTITVTGAPVAPAVAVSNATICAGQATTINASGSGTGAVYTVYSSPGATGPLGVTPLTVSPAITTTYYVQAVANGCSNLGGDVPLIVTVNDLPSANAGNDQSLCMGSSATLVASGGGTYLWNTGATTSSITVAPTLNTSYTVTVTNANGCSAQDVVNVTIVTGGSVQANDDAATVQNNSSVTVNVAANDNGDPNTVAILSGPYHGSATISTNGNVVYTPSGTFEGVDTIRYSICDVNCSMICREARLVITVTKEVIIKVPGGFSPNGDGKNDGFVINGLEFYPDNELIVLNRWGDEVFHAAPYRNDWIGQSQGKGLTLYGTELVEGTYFYILTLDKESKPIKGYVELKRK